jgi:hypothetical protein
MYKIAYPRRNFLCLLVACITLLIATAVFSRPDAAAGYRHIDARGRVDASTLLGKHVVGYQGWFACERSNRGPAALWSHWFRNNQPAPQNLTIDLWPDTAESDPSELCNSGLTRPDGTPAYLFSALNPKTVDRHFAWMQEYGIDGAAVQRFAVHLGNSESHRRLDVVLQNERAAAERHGRIFFVMYDISGADQKSVASDILADWHRLTNVEHITDSPSYLRHRAKPLLGIWGLGFKDRPLGPDQASQLIKALQSGNGSPAVTVLGGVPAGWRTLTADSRSDAQWSKVYRMMDVISPWSVGRFGDDRGAEAFMRQRMVPDVAETSILNIDYMPVIFPGFSWHNLKSGNTPINQISRRCGRFYQAQASNALQAGALMLYSAMFDEVDEGTALFKVLPRHQDLPRGATLLALDADGCSLESDYYLKMAGRISGEIHGADTDRVAVSGLILR